jgi:type 1 fimbriae regulatory protein FimB/type 1 fimbriae regulatory protein FimE
MASCMSRVKNGMPSVHPLTGKELRALRRLQREQEPRRYVFMSERGAPMSPVGLSRTLERLGKAAKMVFGVHPHMLRHACGFKLANQGVDTRSLQHYLGHKNIQHTVHPRRRGRRKQHGRALESLVANQWPCF